MEFASKFYTLEPGDLLYTGTPEGGGLSGLVTPLIVRLSVLVISV
ncbi:fumarylacetoacetate hydrolase family protein [Halomonas sp. PA16-9]